MRIRLLAVGQKMPDWVTTGYLDYAKRLNDDVRLELVEIPIGSVDVLRVNCVAG
jgi:23S rRNA (pseudouridine1915-N3)-methyltransferase